MQNRAFSIDDILPIIKNVTIFSGLSDSQVRVIFENCTIVDVKSWRNNSSGGNTGNRNIYHT